MDVQIETQMLEIYSLWKDILLQWLLWGELGMYFLTV